MTYIVLPLQSLVVNRDNDRHGPMLSEDAALEWLLKNRADHMRRLGVDIADSGVVFEPPLVRKEEDIHVVYDGNRRVASLKLIENPSRAPNAEWKKFYETLKWKMKDHLILKIECRIEERDEFIDEILYRRHTGVQGGVGQSQWDATAKHNFSERTGKGRSINMARQLMAALHSQGYRRPLHSVPISNLNRLLSGEAQRNRVGLRLKKETLYFSHEPGLVFKALEKVVEDLSTRRIVLQDVWDAESKNAYLNTLEGHGVLPNAKFALRNPIPIEDWTSGSGEDDDSEDNANPPPNPTGAGDLDDPGVNPRPRERDALIPQDLVFPNNANAEVRLRAIWNELQYKLLYKRHINAISVLFRVLVEFSINYYLNSIGETKHANSNWTDRMKMAVAAQLSREEIDQEYADIIARFQRREELMSCTSMNKYVHSADLSPSGQHLSSLWDSLQKFIINCLKI